MRLHLLLSFGLLSPLAFAFQAPPAAPQAAPAGQAGAKAAPPLDLASEVRTSVRWLRGAQDAKSGAYGEGVEATAVALRAFAEAPDRYRVTDGPFMRRAFEFLLERQRGDGAIGDEGAGPDALAQQTRASAQALLALGDPGAKEALARALKWLETHDASGTAWEPAPSEGASEELTARARELLAGRDAGGWFAGPKGRVIETGRAMIALSALHARLESMKAPAAPKDAVPLPSFTPADREATRAAIARGATYLAGAADDKGRWGAPGKPDAGLTAMALGALAALPAPRPEPVQQALERGLAWLVSLQKEDGAIHDGKLANYTTSAAIMALTRAGDPAHKPVIARAAAFLQTLQVDEGEGYSEGDIYYGGIGYGSSERPDLSNLQMALEALADSGLEQGSATYAKALHFLERTQNRSESNDLRIVDGKFVIKSGDDGGAAYLPGESKAGFLELADGTKVPRSYGSMTYALLKCFVFAGLERDDPRVQAAYEWCRRNYTLDVNPGFQAQKDPTAAYQGLFYYFQTMARALDLLGVERIETPAGTTHEWRKELCGRLIAMQDRTDGSWINRNSPRWYEGNPILGTAYALLTLDTAMPKEGGTR